MAPEAGHRSIRCIAPPDFCTHVIVTQDRAAGDWGTTALRPPTFAHAVLPGPDTKPERCGNHHSGHNWPVLAGPGTTPGFLESRPFPAAEGCSTSARVPRYHGRGCGDSNKWSRKKRVPAAPLRRRVKPGSMTGEPSLWPSARIRV